MEIRSKHVITMILVATAAVLGTLGCSEEEPTVQDVGPPTVEILFPVSIDQTTISITDSVTCRVRALDPSGIETVEVWCTFHHDSVATRLGELEPGSTEGVFTFWWDAATTRNGAEGLLWAAATDGAGNVGRSESGVPIRVILTGLIGPPTPFFVVVPSLQSVSQAFSFDPSATRDDIEREKSNIKVRWDFDGDGIWDHDTTAGYTAADIVTHQYSHPDVYTARMQAFNSYFAGAAEAYEVAVTATPEFGIPKPQNPDDFVALLPGTYPIGVIARGTGSGTSYDSREEVPDTLFITLSNRVNIEAYEVTNQLYANFLNAALRDSLIDFDPFAGEKEVRLADSGIILIELDQTLTRVKFLDTQTGFGAEDVFVDHPVTGVSWHGALQYAAFYGTRLPTEVEWEVAARQFGLDFNDDGTYLYPWTQNDLISEAHANYSDSDDPFEAASGIETTPKGGYDGHNMDGTFPTEDARSPFGTYDQAGNVAEWVRDWYDEDAYQDLFERYAETHVAPFDPQGPADGIHKVFRGGHYGDTPIDLRVTRRRARVPEERSATIGFRTAYAQF